MAKEIFWYLGYGSNLSKQRFLCYVKGEKPTYGTTVAKGCRNKKFFDVSKPMKIPYKLYFGLPKGRKATQNWGEGGVAFLDRKENTEHTTFCRIWKVTSQQFHDVWDQEGPAWYNDLLKLGEVDGLPVFSFTRRKPGFQFEVETSRPPDVVMMKPSASYMKTIILGLMETYPEMPKRDMLDYLRGREGIQNEYEHTELLELYQQVEYDMKENRE